jgi:soluble lytic murein transglycosylase-like protein
VGISVGFFLFVVPVALNPSRKMPAKSSIDIVCDPNHEGKVRKVLETWVYEHSARISRADVVEIVFEARKTNKALLLLALMEIESNFIPSATSSRGAMGLTQVMPGVWEQHLIKKGIIKERRDLFDIGPSVAAGNEVFDLCLKETKGDVIKALERYLGGQDGAYTKRILNNLAVLYIMVEEIK